MLLIADSGSTKCDWAIVDGEKVVEQTSTMGFNPYFHSASFVAETLSGHDPLMQFRDQITEVYFYGAGCSSVELDEIIAKGLKEVFPQASVLVDHDLLGAAYATWNGQPGITCILGTGSNSCFFDGNNIREEVPAMAYILGDEGSGSYFGKKLISSYFYKRLPQHIADRFQEEYDLKMSDVVEHVYSRPHANVYLASFMKFYSIFKDDPWVKDVIRKGMKEFLEIHVQCYPEHVSCKTHFVGSVATYFRDQLQEAADELGISIGNVIKKPIDGLVKFHLNRKKSRVKV